MKNVDEYPEDGRYPEIKIYGLASVLADITTDYARPFLELVGLTQSQIDAINEAVRPVIDIYECDFYGIVSSELLRLQQEIYNNLQRRNAGPEHVFHLLQMFSDGQRRFLWIPSLAQIGIEAAMRQEQYIAIHVTQKVLKEFRNTFYSIIIEPQTQLKERILASSHCWEKGKMSTWDDLVNSYIFENLGIKPGVEDALRNYSMRKLAGSIASKFDVQQKAGLHREILAMLSRDHSDRLGCFDVNQMLSFDELEQRSADEWDELRFEVKKNFVH